MTMGTSDNLMGSFDNLMAISYYFFIYHLIVVIGVLFLLCIFYFVIFHLISQLIL